MVVVALFPADTLNHVMNVVFIFTCSRGNVGDHAWKIVAVGVAVTNEEDVLVAPAQPVSAGVREGEASSSHRARIRSTISRTLSRTVLPVRSNVLVELVHLGGTPGLVVHD